MVTTVLFQEELQPGLPVDDYILYERIGIGGEGLIFSAWDNLNDSVVAIKFFSKRDEHGSPTNLSAELAAFSRLEHPNIREVLGVGETNDFFYSVMYYFPLGSLSERIFTKTLDMQDALFISVQLASALDFLKEMNIVHRDLKPTNVLLDIENHAYLTDFGLAKPISNTTQVLHTGHGTPIYAAPEQHTLSKINHKSDIYSFGIMLYEMFTGSLPWGGSVSLAIMQLDNREELPDPRTSNPSLPAGMARALRKMTSLNPDFRPDSAGEGIELILQAFEESGVALAPHIRSMPQFSPPEEIDLREAKYLISSKQADWDPAVEKIKINYSHYAFLHSVLSKETHRDKLDQNDLKFMLRGALTYGSAVDEWWGRLGPTEHVEVCQQLIANEAENPVKRTIHRLLEGVPRDQLKQIDSQPILTRLIMMAYESPSLSFKQAIFKLLFAATKPAERWHKVSFSESAELILANLALYDSAIPKEAARFIGHIKSGAAVNALLSSFEDDAAQDTSVLLEVWETAGSLPRSVNPAIKIHTGIELGWKQFIRNRPQLIRTYLAAALAGAIGLSSHVFISTRLPSFVTYSRMLNTLGSGILFGPIIGLGIFLACWIPLKLRVFPTRTRVLLGTIFGGFLTSLALMLFHILFLNAFPTGLLITLGSLILAFGFAVTSYAPSPTWLRMLGGTAGTALGVTGTWLISLGTSSTPMLYYLQEQPLQTSMLISLFSISLGTMTFVLNRRDLMDEGMTHE